MIAYVLTVDACDNAAMAVYVDVFACLNVLSKSRYEITGRGAFLSRGTSLSVFVEQTPSISHAAL